MPAIKLERWLATRAVFLFGSNGTYWYDRKAGLFCVGRESPKGVFKSFGRSPISYDDAFKHAGEKRNADTGKMQQSNAEEKTPSDTLPESERISA